MRSTCARAGVVAALLTAAVSMRVHAQNLAARVDGIVDGATLEVTVGARKERVRLVGAAVPDERELAGLSSRYAKETLSGKAVTLEFERGWKRDKFRRLLVYVRLADGTDFNEKIIRDGYALVVPGYIHARREKYAAAEVEARTEKRGVWADNGAAVVKRPAKPTDGGLGKVTVYITDTGAAYHKKWCKLMKEGRNAVALKDAVEQHYSPCRTCVPPVLRYAQSAKDAAAATESRTGKVYVTLGGRTYHKGDCAYVRTSSIPVKLTDARRRYRPCPRCLPPK